MAGGYDIQLNKTLNRTDLKAKYTGDSDYSGGILYVELLPREISRTYKKEVIQSKRATAKGNRSGITLESSTGLLYRMIEGNKRYTVYHYDFGKSVHGFKLLGSFKASSRANLETQEGKFVDLAEDGGDMTFTWHNLTFNVNITSMTFTENTKKMGYAMDYEILLVLGKER